MKNKEDLELKILKHFVTDVKSVSKAKGMGVKPEHFTFVEEDETICYTRKIVELCFLYFEESNGSMLTIGVLENRLVKSGLDQRPRAKFMLIWEKIQEQDYDENDIHDLLLQIKRDQALRSWKEMHKEGHEVMTTKGLEEALDVVQAKISVIRQELSSAEIKQQSIDITDSAEWFEKEYKKRRDNFDKYKGVYCGLSNIDDVTFGFLPGQVITLIAPSSGGKSIQLMNWAFYANMFGGKNVLYFSFEMDLWLCYLRHISLAFREPYADFKGVQLEDDTLNSVIERLKGMKGQPYFEYDVNLEHPTVEYVDSRIRELTMTKGKPDLIVCDYIGKMTTENTRKDASSWQHAGDALIGLHLLSKRHDVPVLTAQQLSNDVLKENRKLKSSGKIAKYEQDVSYGDKRIIHESHFVIALEPDKSENMCTYYPVKMRDGTFEPFSARLDLSCNLLTQLTPEEQEDYNRRKNSPSTVTSQPPKVSSTNGNTVVDYDNSSNIYKPEDLEIIAPDDWSIMSEEEED